MLLQVRRSTAQAWPQAGARRHPHLPAGWCRSLGIRSGTYRRKCLKRRSSSV